MYDVKDTVSDGNAIQSTALIQAIGENRQEAVELLLDHKSYRRGLQQVRRLKGAGS